MTSEYLLDAVGLIDDDLIQDAESLPRPKAIPWRRWGAWAACLALVLALGYGVTHLSMSSKNCSGAAPSASCATGENSACADAAAEGASDSPQESEHSSNAPTGRIYLSGGEYVLTGQVLDTLPEGSREVGVLAALSPDAPEPAADNEALAGCALFEAPDGLLYVQLHEGGWAAAEPPQS